MFVFLTCFLGKTDPYVILSLGDQVIRSKKNSQTTVIGPPGEPIWNQVKFLNVTASSSKLLMIKAFNTSELLHSIIF